MWLAIWNNLLLLPPKKIGTTVASDFKISLDVNLFQNGSRGRLKSFAEVATVPPGKIPTIPPDFKKRIASFLVCIFWILPSLFSSKLIGRIISSRSLAFLKTLFAIILKSFLVLDKIYPGCSLGIFYPRLEKISK